MFYVSETQNLDKPMEPDETYSELRSHYSNVRQVMRAAKSSGRHKTIVSWNKSSNPNSVRDRLSTQQSSSQMSLEDKILQGYFKPFSKRDANSLLRNALKDFDEEGNLAV